MKRYLKLALAGAVFAAVFPVAFVAAQHASVPKWPEITPQQRPWTRWWWQGSAVNPTDLTWMLEEYQKAGLGGVEITPIYGVKGYENQFIDFLSPRWMEMLAHTLKESARLGLGVDLAQASGWPFGGPWVDDADASKYVAFKTYQLAAGETLNEKVEYIQHPILRTVGEKIAMSELVDPIVKNPDLQLHAFDQVRFEKPLPLQALMAYSDDGKTIDLTDKVDRQGRLAWRAPSDHWTLYAVFEGWHGKMVERAGPGGEGYAIDHFSRPATVHYLAHFNRAFQGFDGSSIRAFFNDSYEVDDAQGEANWTTDFFREFLKRRGYDLKLHLPALFGNDTAEKNVRVLTDYRETIADLLLDNYTKTWHEWAQNHNVLIRNQAHGSPANILDLYAATDIPEIEGTDLLRIKFAASAAHVSGKPLVSSESATWENEHFRSKLGDIKKAMDLFFVGGVNHTFYHGANYTPKQDTWPGWLFYAAVHFTPNNPFWTDFGKLNHYVARVQSFMQQGEPDNEVLLYLPIYDAYAKPGKTLLQHFDGIDKGFHGTPVEAQAIELAEKGYRFDFISDKQLLKTHVVDRAIQTEGARYGTVVVPQTQYMPLATVQQLAALAKGGATIIFHREMPTDVPGFGDLKARQNAYQQLCAQLRFNETPAGGIQEAALGSGRFIVGDDLEEALNWTSVNRETMRDQGLYSVRRKSDHGYYYFIDNRSEVAVDGWIPIQVSAQTIALFNPMTEKTGYAAIERSGDQMLVYLQLAPGETCILDTYSTGTSGQPYPYMQTVGQQRAVTGTWDVRFIQGGPRLPANLKIDHLRSWTEFEGDDVKNFSGTAQYTISFAKPSDTADTWRLDLGTVEESAVVVLNGQELGTLLGPVYQLEIPTELLKASNRLEIRISNSMANRIAYMDRSKIPWKKFYNTNMPSRFPENQGADGLFTAVGWVPAASGLIGPVTLTPLQHFHPKKVN